MKTKTISITILSLLAVCGAAFASEAAPEGDLKPFLGEPQIEQPPFPRPPVFAKAPTGRPVRPNGSFRSLPPKANS
jgi:hypothetical protein